jgi:hypothetical protein
MQPQLVDAGYPKGVANVLGVKKIACSRYLGASLTEGLNNARDASLPGGFTGVIFTGYCSFWIICSKL